MRIDQYESMVAHLDRSIEQKRSEVPDGVVLMCGDAMEPKPINWLWHSWLALGKFHLLAGAPGQGKTTITLSFAATVTNGGKWPDGTRAPKGNVLIWSGEDDPTDTLLPRLIASGVDRSRVYFITGARIAGQMESFDPSRDMHALQTEAERIGDVKLIIVDPVVSAVTGDSHKNTETRRALQPLVDLAANMNAVLIGITHFGKGGQGGDPVQRVLGSVAFTAVARVVLVAAKVKNADGEGDRRILARGKSNIGPDDGGFEYHLEHSEPLPGIEASYIGWGAGVQGSARDLLTDPNQDEGDESAVDSAEDFLRQVLAEGQTPSKTVQAEAKTAGHSWASVRRASENLVIKKTRGDGGAWYWRLGGQVAHVAQGAHTNRAEQVEQVQPIQAPKVADVEVF